MNRVDSQVGQADDRGSWGILSGRFLRRRVDPRGGRQIRGLWPALDEALGMRRVRGRQHLLPMRADRGGLAEMHDGRGGEPQPLWRCSWLYQGKKTCPNARPSAIDPNRSGNWGQYLSVLNWASENGLSLETCGRLCVFTTPRSARRRATGHRSDR